MHPCRFVAQQSDAELLAPAIRELFAACHGLTQLGELVVRATGLSPVQGILVEFVREPQPYFPPVILGCKCKGFLGQYVCPPLPAAAAAAARMLLQGPHIVWRGMAIACCHRVHCLCLQVGDPLDQRLFEVGANTRTLNLSSSPQTLSP